MTRSDFESLFQRALVSRGEAYVMAESELRESPESAPVLRGHLGDPDPIARLAASVMLESVEARAPDFEEVPRYFAELERYVARTVAGTPPITGVVANLTTRFGGRLTGFLALRLVRQPQTGWRALVALAYLDRHKDPATTEAIIRFAAQTRERPLQAIAARVLVGLGDPALAQKINAERDRLAAEGGSLPAVVASLAAPSGHTVA